MPNQELPSQELFEKNLALFKQHFPEIHAELEKLEPQTSLVQVGEDDWDISFRGTGFYQMGAREHSRRQMAALAPHVRRMYVSPPRSEVLCHVSSDHLYRLMRTAVDNGIEFQSNFQVDEAFHLVVMGIGLGMFLDPLMDRLKPRSLCILDVNYEGLYHSLRLVDWQPIFDLRINNRRRVTIVISPDFNYLVHAARGHCRYCNPIATDGLTVFTHYENSALRQAHDIIFRDGNLILTGLGFFQDEMEMVRATYQNLQTGEFLLYQRRTVRTDVPVFVIGSGPSIDNDIEFIKENADRAVIISCGTALRVLRAHGIVPDFQILMENGEITFDLVSSIKNSFGLDGTTLIASTTITTGVKEMFDRAVLFFRPNLAPYRMFRPGMMNAVDEVGPTVTNCGLSVALELGFGNVYLLGCDLGSRSPDRHHSNFSSYAQKGRQDGGHKDLVMEFEGSLQARVLGNFGGVVYSDDNFAWSRDTMERSIRTYRPMMRRVYNCSDGSLIQGATPIDSLAVELESTPQDKERLMSELLASFPRDSSEIFMAAYREADWAVRFEEYLDGLIALVQADYPHPDDYMEKIIFSVIQDAERPTLVEDHMFRGSLLLSLLCSDFYIKRVADEAKRAEFREIARRVMLVTLDKLKAQARRYVELLPDAVTQEMVLSSLRDLLAEYKPEPVA
jgi:hypothetical protein